MAARGQPGSISGILGEYTRFQTAINWILSDTTLGIWIAGDREQNYPRNWSAVRLL